MFKNYVSVLIVAAFALLATVANAQSLIVLECRSTGSGTCNGGNTVADVTKDLYSKCKPSFALWEWMSREWGIAQNGVAGKPYDCVQKGCNAKGYYGCKRTCTRASNDGKECTTWYDDKWTGM